MYHHDSQEVLRQITRWTQSSIAGLDQADVGCIAYVDPRGVAHSWRKPVCEARNLLRQAASQVSGDLKPVSCFCRN